MTEQTYIQLLINAALCAFECNLPKQCCALNDKINEALKVVHLEVGQ